jgi:BON domain
MSNDQIIVDEIRATLAGDPRIHNPAELAVSERAGTVTLRGTVRSLHQRRTAVAIQVGSRRPRGRRRGPRRPARSLEGRGAARRGAAGSDVR